MLPSISLDEQRGAAASSAAGSLLPLNITRLAPEYSSSPRLSTQSLPPTVLRSGKGDDVSGDNMPIPDSTFTQHHTPSSFDGHLNSPPSSSHHTPITPTFDLSTRPVSYSRGGFSPPTRSRLSGMGSIPPSPGTWRDSTMSQSNFRDSMATVTSSRSFNLRELPDVCIKFPLPPPKEIDELRRSESSSPSINSTLVASASLASVVTDATITTSRAVSPPPDAEVKVATVEHVPVARGMQVRQVAEGNDNNAGNRMSLVSTETGESVGWMPQSRDAFSSDQQSIEDESRSKVKQWFPVLAPVWGSGGHPSGNDADSLLPERHATPQPEDDLRRASTDTFNSSAVQSSSMDHSLRLTSRGTRAPTRESLAAWDEDMPLPTPPAPSISRFDSAEHFETSSNYSVPVTPPVTDPIPSFRYHPPQSDDGHIQSSLRCATDDRNLVSPFSLTSGTPTSGAADYDSDGSDGSEASRNSHSMSPFGRNSFGCDGGDDDATEDRARKLREGFFANPSAGRSHSSLNSVEDRAKTPTKAGSRSLGSTDSTRNPELRPFGLRSAVLPQPMARVSIESLHETATPITHNAPLRKRSLTNLLRKKEDQRRTSNDKRLPALPPAVEETEEEYYVDRDPESVFNVCNDKYLRRTLLSPPEPEADEVFDVWRPPSQRRLWEAGTCNIRNEDGELVPFSDLFPTWEDAKPNGPTPRTVLIFLRHFWCGPCQDYTLESISTLDPKLLAAHNIRVFIIGSGHWKLLKPYRTLFNCPFPFFTDGPRRLFGLLGMIKKISMMPFNMPFRAAERANYNHRPLMKQAFSGFKNAFLHMPIANPGNWTQLGGEFVLSPGYKCEFSHRMTTMTNHMEAFEVIRHIGVDHPSPQSSKTVPGAPSKQQVDARDEIDRLTRELRQWQEDRDAELQRMRNKKTQRSGGGLSVPVDEKAFRRISATSGWSGYVRTVLRDDAAAELSHMPEVPNAHKQQANGEAGGVVTIGPEVVTIGPESQYVSAEGEAASKGVVVPYAIPRALASSGASSVDRSSAGTVPDLVDSLSASTGAEDSLCSATCSLDPEVSATFGGIAGSPVEPDDLDPAEMERRFTAAMAAARGQERTAASLNNRWSMPPQLPRHTNTAGEVGVAY